MVQSMGVFQSKTPSALLFLIQWIIQIRELVEPLKLLIQWKTQKNQQSRSIPWSTLRRWIVMEVESSSSFNPTQRLQKESPMKDTGKMGEKLQETMSSMSSGMATSTRKALKIEVERGSKVNQGELQSNDFAKKPLKHKNSSGEVKLDSQKDFPQGKVWKPVLTTEQIAREKRMGMPTPPPFFFFFFFFFYFLFHPPPHFF